MNVEALESDKVFSLLIFVLRKNSLDKWFPSCFLKALFALTHFRKLER